MTYKAVYLVVSSVHRQSGDVEGSAQSLCRTELTDAKSDCTVSEQVSNTGFYDLFSILLHSLKYLDQT